MCQGEGKRDSEEAGRLRYGGRGGGHAYPPSQGGAQHRALRQVAPSSPLLSFQEACLMSVCPKSQAFPPTLALPGAAIGLTVTRPRPVLFFCGYLLNMGTITIEHHGENICI
jgi:hypothetical protein